MKKYALIGHPLSHSLSPYIHDKLFHLNKICANYELIDILPKELYSKYEEKLVQLDGYNITLPYKHDIIPYLSELEENARVCGAVNTVHKSKGYNTDGYGFKKSLQKCGCNLAGHIVVIGYGGAARVIIYEALEAGCTVDVLVRKKSILQAGRMTKDFWNKKDKINVYELESYLPMEKISLLVNATPAGMNPNFSSMPEINEKVFKCSEAVFDAVYNPIDTKFLKYAKLNDCKVISGIFMLVHQAIKSHYIWYGGYFNESDIRNLEKFVMAMLK